MSVCNRANGKAHLPMQETLNAGSVPGLGRSSRKEHETHSSDGNRPWTEEPGWLQSIGLDLATTEATQQACKERLAAMTPSYPV